MKLRIFICFFSFLFLISNTFAQKLKLGELFNEGVVLQQNSKVLIWGFAAPIEDVLVKIQGKSYKSKTDSKGNWTVKLNNLKAGGPYSMTTYCSTDSIQLNEVYVGEVWVAGGQSNMGFTLEKSDGAKAEIENAKNKNIRFVLVPIVNYEGEKVRGDMNWRTATTENVGPMSGVAYFFAKQLQEKLNVPVGIICCNKGGTAAEVWMSRETLLKNTYHAPIVTSYENYLSNLGKEKYEQLFSAYEKELKVYFDSVRLGYKAIRPVEPMGDKHYKRPFGLYNTMLKRIIPYTSKGVIWYQGEANATRAEQYRTLFPALIDEWRSDFKNPKMPFLFVQLANYDHPSYGEKPVWAELREAQLLTWQKVKNTGMAVSMDVGNKNDIHPTNKKPVGERLAATALNTVYKMKIPYSGPVFKSMKIKENQIILTFDFVYSGLSSKGELKGFTVCG
ncbi:MAG TPA: sialate O-acetylesterase, partial [Paludibacter sp.]|nr:sialate O-acetylesterase [Paludibacter sp.]